MANLAFPKPQVEGESMFARILNSIMQDPASAAAGAANPVGMATPISQVRNLERILRALPQMGAVARRASIEEVVGNIMKQPSDKDRYLVEFLGTARGIGNRDLHRGAGIARGAILAPSGAPEGLVLQYAGPGMKSADAIMDRPSRILATLRALLDEKRWGPGRFRMR